MSDSVSMCNYVQLCGPLRGVWGYGGRGKFVPSLNKSSWVRKKHGTSLNNFRELLNRPILLEHIITKQGIRSSKREPT